MRGDFFRYCGAWNIIPLSKNVVTGLSDKLTGSCRISVGKPSGRYNGARKKSYDLRGTSLPYTLFRGQPGKTGGPGGTGAADWARSGLPSPTIIPSGRAGSTAAGPGTGGDWRGNPDHPWGAAGVFCHGRGACRAFSPRDPGTIKVAGRVISVSHPFDPQRSGWSLQDLLFLVGQVDALEVLNSRCLSVGMNRRAVEFARQHGLPGTVGWTPTAWWNWGVPRSGCRRFNLLEGCGLPWRWLKWK